MVLVDLLASRHMHRYTNALYVQEQEYASSQRVVALHITGILLLLLRRRHHDDCFLICIPRSSSGVGGNRLTERDAAGVDDDEEHNSGAIIAATAATGNVLCYIWYSSSASLLVLLTQASYAPTQKPTQAQLDIVSYIHCIYLCRVAVGIES
jgi:O-acetyl-ADP-ribose deacetylase (regulator of RNase III)